MSMHDSNIYDKEYLPLLDDAYQHMVNMDAAADYHGYRCPERNARAERAAVRYEQLRRKAQQMKMRAIEVLPVDEPLPPLPQPPWCPFEDDNGVPCGECVDCQKHMAEVSWQ